MAEQGGLRKVGRDSFIGLVAGLVIEPTLKALRLDDLVPYMPQVWLSICAFITIDALYRNKRLRLWAPAFFGSLGVKGKIMSFMFVALIGAATFSVEWLFITSVFKTRAESSARAAIENSKSNQPVTQPSPNRETTGIQDAIAKSLTFEGKAEHHFSKSGSVILKVSFAGLSPSDQELQCLVFDPDGKKAHRGRSARASGVTGIGLTSDFPESFGLKKPKAGNYHVLWIVKENGGGQSAVAEDYFSWPF